ncbi:MAG: hypothetical protein V7707_05870 [Motiliproteus sp.]
MPRCNLFTFTSLIVTALLSSPSFGQSDTFRWDGFINQGYTHSSGNSFFGDSSNGSWEFTDIGLGASWRQQPRLLFAARAIYRKAGNTTDDNVQLDYGLVDFTAISQMDYGLNLRAGRVKNPYGFYNETRDILSSRPSVLLPESIYRDSLRKVFHTSDGAALSGYKQWSSTLVSVDFVVGKPIMSDIARSEILGINFSGSFDDEKGLIGRLMIEHPDSQLRYGISMATLEAGYTPAAGEAVLPGNFDMDVALLSIEKRYNDWTLTAEYQLNDFNISGLSAPGFQKSSEEKSYYGQLGYRWSDAWQGLIRYDTYYQDPDQKDNPEFYSKDLTASVKYRYSARLTLAADLHYIEGTGWLSEIDQQPGQERDKYWTLLALQLGFTF